MYENDYIIYWQYIYNTFFCYDKSIIIFISWCRVSVLLVRCQQIIVIQTWLPSLFLWKFLFFWHSAYILYKLYVAVFWIQWTTYGLPATYVPSAPLYVRRPRCTHGTSTCCGVRYQYRTPSSRSPWCTWYVFCTVRWRTCCCHGTVRYYPHSQECCT